MQSYNVLILKHFSTYLLIITMVSSINFPLYCMQRREEITEMSPLLSNRNTEILDSLLKDPIPSQLDSFYKNTYESMFDTEKKQLLNSVDLSDADNLYTTILNQSENRNMVANAFEGFGICSSLFFSLFTSMENQKACTALTSLKNYDSPYSAQVDHVCKNSSYSLAITSVLAFLAFARTSFLIYDQKIRIDTEKAIDVLENLKADKKRLNNESVQQ